MAPPWSSDVDEFLAILLASQLLSCQEIRHACADFTHGYGDENVLDALCKHLVEKGLLTAWQCEKLRTGKFKGFYVDNDPLLEHLEVGESETIYRAEDFDSGDVVALAVWLAHEKPYVRCRVMDAMKP